MDAKCQSDGRVDSVPAVRQSVSGGHYCCECEPLEARVLFSTDTWTGLGTILSSWSTFLNWSTLAAPTNGQDVVFSGSLRTTNNNDLSNLSLNSITFSANGFTVSGNAVTLPSGGGGVTADSSVTTGDTLSLPLTLAGTQTFTVTNSGASLTLAGVLSGASAGINKSGSGILILSGANTFGGSTTVNAGTLRDGAAGVIPDTSLVSVGASGTFDLNSHAETIGSLAGSGNVTLGSATLTAGGDDTSTTFSGVISGSGGLSKAGTGTLLLDGANTYSGTTTVSAGTLGGSGSVAGIVSVASGATLSPGAGAPGLFSTGNLTLASGASYSVALNGTSAGAGYGQTDVSGTVALGGATLNVSLGYASHVGDTYTIINNDGTADAVTGTFNGLAEGAVFTVDGKQFQITYHGGDGNDVVLTQVNSSPILNVGGAPALTNVNENDQASSGTLISTLIASGPVNFITDADTGAAQGIAVTAADTTEGSWQFSTNDGSTWTALGTPSTTSARLLASDTQTLIRFLPTTNFNGTVSSAITFKAWDQTSGSNGATANTTSSGGTTAFSTAAGTASVTVNAVNQPPVLTVPGAQTVNEDTPLTLTGISLSDVDANGGVEELTLSAVNGTLTLGSVTGLTFVSGSNGSSAMSFTGTVAQINSAVTSVTYQGLLNYNGTDTVTLVANDQGNSGAGGAQTNTKAVSITVSAVNDPPVVTVPSAQSVNEDTALALSGISVSDVDANGASEQLTLSAANGTLALAATTGLTLISGTNGSSSMTYAGTLSNLNTDLATLSYQGLSNFNGSDTVTVLANDEGNTGSGGAMTDTKTITVAVNAVNDPPVLTVPGAQSVNEDTPLAITGTSLADVDANGAQESLTLSVAHGTLTLAQSTGLTFVTGANDSSSMSFTGTLANINAAIATLTYQGSSNYNGTDTVTLLANDQGNTGLGGPLSDTKTIALTVNAVNDPPVLSVPGAQSVNEDAQIVISGSVLSDVDANGNPEQLTLSAVNGTITLATTSGLTITAGANGTSTMTFTGTLTSINAAIAALTYQGTSHFFGSDTITLTANDLGNTGLGGAMTTTQAIAVTVNEVNQPPVLTVPGAQSLNENSSLGITGITLADLDAGSGTEKITLSASNGTLTLATTVGLTFASGASAMTFTGTVSAINSALSTLTYTPNAGYFGADTINLFANDQGNTGLGGALTDSKTIAITVNEVNQPPALTVPGSQTATEDIALPITGVSISDVDADGAQEKLSLAVANGTLTLSLTSGLTFTSGGNGTSAMTFTGTLADINASLATLSYQGTFHFFGADTINLTANDQGNTGLGGALTASASIPITVQEVNQAPTLSVPGPQSVNENSPVTISGVSMADIDAGAGQEQLTISAVDGNLTLSTTSGLTFVSGSNGSSSMTFTGTINQINAALSGLVYQGATNFFGSDSVTLLANDEGNTGLGGPLTASASIAVTVNEVNRPPVLTVPGAQTVAENGTLAVSGVSVADPDAGSGQELLTLSALNGSLTLGTTAGLTLTGGANGSASVTVTGSLANLNASLATLSYQPANGYFGSDTITLGVNDQGNTGLGGPLTDSKTIAVSVGEVNQPPVLTVPGSQTVAENATLPIAGISLSDLDADGGVESVTISASHGTLTLGVVSGITFSSGSNGSSSFVASGTLANLNAALSTVSYQGAPNYNGSDTITFLANDQGNTGAGGALTNLQTIAVTVTAVDQPPVLSVPGAQTVNENGTLSITPVSLSDLDANGGIEQITLAALHGTLTVTNGGGLTITAGGNGTSTVTFTGTVANLNTALAGLSYQPASNYSGADTVTLVANDLGNTGAGGPLIDVQTIQLTINEVNQAPVLTVPGPQSIAEGGMLAIAGVSLNDSDAGAGQEKLSISADAGVVILGENAGLTFTSGASGTSSMTFAGTIASINAALFTLTYQPSANFSGADTLTLVADDQGNTGLGGPLTDTKTISVGVGAIDQAPVLTVPGTQSVNENSALAISGISLADVDAGSGSEKITLSTLNGTLTLGQTTGLTFVSGSNGATSLSVAGTLADLNAALATLNYQGNANFNGTDTLVLTANDQGNTGAGGPLTDTRTIQIVVAAVNQPPALILPGPLTVNENSTLAVTGVSIADVDADGGIETLTAAASNGTLTLATTSGVTFTSGANGASTWTATGTLADLNAALTGLSYTPSSDYRGADTISLTINDQGNSGAGGPLSGTGSIAVTVNAVNQPPNVIVPGSQTVTANASLVITGVSVGDPDGGAGVEEIVVTDVHGALTLASTTGLTFAAGANGTGTIALLGTLADLNAALAAITYQPVPGFTGTDTISVLANDRGNAGAGGAMTDLKSIAVLVTPSNEPAAVMPTFFSDIVRPVPASPSGNVPDVSPIVTPPSSGPSGATGDSTIQLIVPTFPILMPSGPSGGPDLTPSQPTAPNSAGEITPGGTVLTPRETATPGLALVAAPLPTPPQFLVVPPRAEPAVLLRNVALEIEGPFHSIDRMVKSQFVRPRLGPVNFAIFASGAFTCGYMLWFARGGALLGSMLAAAPAWRWLDPLPILDSPGLSPRLDQEDDSDERRLRKLID